MSEQSLSAEDRVQIMDLIARYSRSLDAADIDGWLTVWRPDAVLNSGSGPATGHEELRAWANRLLEHRGVGANPPKLIHFPGLPLINGGGDQATSQTYTIILDYDADGRIRIPLVGRYDDELVRIDGRWWIQQRTINGDLHGPAEPNRTR